MYVAGPSKTDAAIEIVGFEEPGLDVPETSSVA
jgi:hypothetical protein